MYVWCTCTGALKLAQQGLISVYIIYIYIYIILYIYIIYIYILFFFFFNKHYKPNNYLHEFWNLEVKNGERDILKFNKGCIGKFWIRTISNYLSDWAVNAAIRWFLMGKEGKVTTGSYKEMCYVWFLSCCHLYWNDKSSGTIKKDDGWDEMLCEDHKDEIRWVMGILTCAATHHSPGWLVRSVRWWFICLMRSPHQMLCVSFWFSDCCYPNICNLLYT